VASDNLDVASQKNVFTSQALRLATLLHEIFETCLFHGLGVCIFCDTEILLVVTVEEKARE